MEKITKAQLEAAVARLNRIAGTLVEPYTLDTATGRMVANVGNYHLDGAYGGWKLCRLTNASGGTSDVTTGYRSKREVYDLVQAFIAGLEARTVAA